MMFRPELDEDAPPPPGKAQEWMKSALLAVGGYAVLYAVMSIPQ